tara:strand:- start:958 stop:2442 length:1485 start_codon:yes stop_codon:yes gene_type:complete
MKQIIKNFNNLIKKTIFKVQDKTNNNFNISRFNKYLITFIGLLFFYLFYLLIPLSYDKTWVQTNIESKLLDEFKINLSTSADISYRILPSPHFLIRDSKISVADGNKQKSIAEIKDFKIYLGQGNFFDKEKMDLKRVVINNANFLFSRSDTQLLKKFRSKKLPNKVIEINNSNIFFRDNFGEIISIIKIDKTILFYNFNKLSNFINLNGETFNVPFTLIFNNGNDLNKYEKITFNSKSLKLNIVNEFIIKKDQSFEGKNSISLLNNTFNTKYNVKEKSIIFESGDSSRIGNSLIIYDGELSISPFYLNLNVDLKNYKILKLLNFNPILLEFIQSGLLFNENININTSINIKSNNKKNFHNAKFNFNISNGKIDLNKTKFINDDIGSLEFNNSNIFIKNNELVFNGDVLVDIQNSDNLFSLLNTNKTSRKSFKTILINLDYSFLSNRIKFNNVKIDNKNASSQFLTIINSFNNNELNNINKGRRLINELLKVYAG